MVALNNSQTKTVPDTVCPKCFKLLPGPTVLNESPDRYGRITRIYLGWCFDCKIGCEVIQFKRDDRWVIHKYQYYCQTSTFYAALPTHQWTTLNELPEPPVILQGPGGDYDQAIELRDTNISAMKTLKKAVDAIGAIIESLLQAMERKSENSNQNNE